MRIHYLKRMFLNKSNHWIRSPILLTLLLSAAVLPLNGKDLYEEKKISSIQVEFKTLDPNLQPDTRTVLARIKTKEGDSFSQFTFDDDLKTLSEEYDRVQPSIELRDGELIITLLVEPRPTIRHILFSGNDQFSTSTLQKELDIQGATLFNRVEFNKSFNKLKDLYIKKGYFESQLTYSVESIPNTNEIDINVQIIEGRAGNISDIVFDGFSNEEVRELRGSMYLKRYNFLTTWLTGAGKFQEEALEQDRMTIVNYLHNQGFADARVTIQLIDDPKSQKMIVLISAERGCLYHIGAVSFEGITLFTSDEITKRSLINEQDIYSPEKIRETAQAIKDFYGQKGYIDANVQYETCLHEEEAIFDTTFSIDEGRQYKIGMVQIFGNHTTQCNVILRESLLVPGELFDSRKLKATQQRLEAVGYFKSVNVYAVRSPDESSSEDNYRDVYIEVEETTTGNISLFMGFSSTDSIYGGLDFTERNFNIVGTRSALCGRFHSFRGGGEFLHSKLTIGKKEESFLISWVNPYVNDSLWRLGVELSETFSELQSDSDTEAAKVRTYGGSLFTNYPLTAYWTAGIRERMRHTSNTLKLVIPDNGVPTDSYIIAKEKNEGKGFLSGLSANLSYDSTDRAAKPHRGWRSYLETELVGLGGRFHFGKLSYINSIYFPVTCRGTLKFRGDVHFIAPYGNKSLSENIPYSERLFLGGEGTVRGYQPFIIGDKIHYRYYDPATKEMVNKTTETPVGGLTSCLLSAEYNIALFRAADVFFFFDSGSVSQKTWTFDTFRSSFGVGARLEINPGTPIVLGYGIPINPEKKSDVQRFFFSMGGQF